MVSEMADAPRVPKCAKLSNQLLHLTAQLDWDFKSILKL